MQRIASLIVVFASLLAGGCATITGSEMQQVALTAKDASGTALDGVKCSLKNDKGSWEATAPAFVDIRRSAEDLNVDCKKSGEKDGLLKAISRASGGMVGNIIFGGGIGALIDHNKGTGYNYPDNLPVEMGKVVLVDRKDQGDVQAQPQSHNQQMAIPSTGGAAQSMARDTTQTMTPPQSAREKPSDNDAFMRSLHDNKGPGRSF